MNQRLIASTALASVLALGLAGQVAAQEKAMPMEKCFGVAKMGENDCANLSGSHSCAGQSKMDKQADDWKYVAKGTCKTMGGLDAEAAKKMNVKK
ncbi:BufA1 family periplasmic bufferin-type metallophore [Sphaerotilaceae bacterium SBD11-9]